MHWFLHSAIRIVLQIWTKVEVLIQEEAEGQKNTQYKSTVPTLSHIPTLRIKPQQKYPAPCCAVSFYPAVHVGTKEHL